MKEEITWYPAAAPLDSDTTVLLRIHDECRECTEWAGEVMKGYHDGENWRTIHGEWLPDGDVTHWATMPMGPPSPLRPKLTVINGEGGMGN